MAVLGMTATRSYGGFMTALGLARASDGLAAVVDYSAIHNRSAHLSSLGEPIDGGDANRRATECSPIATIDQWHLLVLPLQDAYFDRQLNKRSRARSVSGFITVDF